MAKKKNVRSSGTYVSYVCEFKKMSAKKLKNFGRERCIMRSVPADKIDKEVLLQIAYVLSDPFRFAEEWLKEVDRAEAKATFENLSKQVAEKEKAQDKNIADFSRFTDDEVRNKLADNIDKITDELKALKKRLKEAEFEYNSYQNKADRRAQYKNAMKKAANIWDKQEISSSTQGEFIKFIYDLPFKEKQRIIEAVIAPENGGRCFLRYQTPNDLVDYPHIIDKKLANKPLKDLKSVIDMDFKIDLDRIEALITGLNKKDLLSNFDLYQQHRLLQRSTLH